ncbi:MAG TPA: type IX secretion system protein PorQ [Saprospiraceae bacterium]|nr:type IX secretion system protein PorQ [Saprospiraceae bacterium]
MECVLQPGKRSNVIFVFLFCCSGFLFGQRGGERIFEFIHLPTSARSTALAGSQVAAWTDDYNLVGGNPALLSESMSGSLIFQHNFHFAGIDNGFAGYAKHFPKLNSTLHAGIHYLSYGQFTAADDMGNVEGEFKASEIAINAGIARQLNERIKVGLLMRYVQSSFEAYNSSGLVFDAGLSYQSENELNHYAFIIRGAGVQFSKYYPDDESGTMPLDVQIGISKKLEYVPFRLSILAHDLNRWDLRYNSPLDDNSGLGFGEEEPREPSKFGESVDNVFRHLTFGGEFLIGKEENLKLRLGYHHQRRKELSVVNLRSLSGFSAGVGLRLKSFVLDYGFAVYHQAGSTKHLGLRIDIARLMGKKIID